MCLLQRDAGQWSGLLWRCHWGWLLSPQGQALATWLYLGATVAILVFIFLQVSHMHSARALEAFQSFHQLWDAAEVREARRFVYVRFGPLLKIQDTEARRAEAERVIRALTPSEVQRIDIVVNKSSLVGILWAEGLFPPRLRKSVIDYIYKTVLLSWDCLAPYIEFVRGERAEDAGGESRYATAFEDLLRGAEKRLGTQPRPRPGWL